MREMVPSNRKSDKPIVVVSRAAEARKRQRRNAPERPKNMSRFAWILLLLPSVVTAFSAQEFRGQVGRIDEAQLGMDWWRIRQGEFPILPVEGVRGIVLICERLSIPTASAAASNRLPSAATCRRLSLSPSVWEQGGPQGRLQDSRRGKGRDETGERCRLRPLRSWWGWLTQERGLPRA